MPQWLTLAPSLFFACAAVLLIAGGLMKAGLMAYYNLTAADMVRFGEDRRLWGQLVLNRENVFNVLWGLVNGACALAVSWSWMWDESRRALKLSAAFVVVSLVSASLSKTLAGSNEQRPVMPAHPRAAPGPSPAVAVRPPAGFPPTRTEDAPSNAPVVTIWLDRLTEAERSRNEQILKREFQSLRNYVPDTLRIDGNTLVWRATVPVQSIESHKLEAIAILRRSNIRLSQFSEQWLKGREGKGPFPGPPLSPAP